MQGVPRAWQLVFDLRLDSLSLAFLSARLRWRRLLRGLGIPMRYNGVVEAGIKGTVRVSACMLFAAFGKSADRLFGGEPCCVFAIPGRSHVDRGRRNADV